MSLFRSPMVVLDVETTGLFDAWVRVVEIGAVLLDVHGTEIGAWESLIRPDVLDERANKALEINHLTRDMLMSAAPVTMVIGSFMSWIRSNGSPYVTSFNVGFDREHMERSGAKALRWASCVMVRSREPMAYSGGRGPSLKNAAAHFGIPQQEPAHRALADARTAALIACAIRRAEIASAAEGAA